MSENAKNQLKVVYFVPVARRSLQLYDLRIAFDQGKERFSMTKTKIFGIGLNKTGTTSLKQAFVQLGFRHLDRKPRLFKHWKKREFEQIFDWIEDYETFEDWPWPLMVPELLERYPDAKFILTRRTDARTWVESLKRQAEKTNPDNNPRKVIYGHSYPHGHEAAHIAFYEKHLEKVRAFFANKPAQLSEFCWEEGDSWPDICAFLGVDQPRKPFPHANKSKKNGRADPEFLYENQRRIQEKLKNLN